MTDQQYEKCKAKGIQIYQIWIKGKKFHKQKCTYKNFDNSWIAIGWINKAIPYAADIRADFMFASEDKLEQCKKKLIKYLKDEQIRIIREAQKKLDALEMIQ